MTPGTQRSALEITLAADSALADPVHAGLLALARSLADELDAQGDDPQTRTQATYAGQLGAIRRVVKDDRELRRRSASADKPAGRLALIKQSAADRQKGVA